MPMPDGQDSSGLRHSRIDSDTRSQSIVKAGRFPAAGVPRGVRRTVRSGRSKVWERNFAIYPNCNPGIRVRGLARSRSNIGIQNRTLPGLSGRFMPRGSWNWVGCIGTEARTRRISTAQTGGGERVRCLVVSAEGLWTRKEGFGFINFGVYWPERPFHFASLVRSIWGRVVPWLGLPIGGRTGSGCGCERHRAAQHRARQCGVLFRKLIVWIRRCRKSGLFMMVQPAEPPGTAIPTLPWPGKVQIAGSRGRSMS